MAAMGISLVPSHLTRGAWIEIANNILNMGMKMGRTSHEVRGLKYKKGGSGGGETVSHLTRGAWIEI